MYAAITGSKATMRSFYSFSPFTFLPVSFVIGIEKVHDVVGGFFYVVVNEGIGNAQGEIAFKEGEVCALQIGESLAGLQL